MNACQLPCIVTFSFLYSICLDGIYKQVAITIKKTRDPKSFYYKQHFLKSDLLILFERLLTSSWLNFLVCPVAMLCGLD